MAKVKKKHKGEKGQNSWLEGFLRFEIVVLLFVLIGFYYFLSFSPIRMPKEPLVSSHATLAPLPAIPEVVTPVQEEVAVLVDDAEFSDLPAGVVGPVAEPNSEFPVEGVPVTPIGPVVGVALTETESIGKSPIEDDGQKQRVEPSEVSEPLPVESAELATSPPETPAEVPVPTPVPVASLAEAKVVEVGSYVLQSDLRKFRSQLEELGFVVQTETQKRPTPMYRLFLGPYFDQRKVQEMTAVVRKMGDQPFLQTWDSGTAVVIGSFYLQASVAAWENMYHAVGYDPKVRQESLMVPHTWLRLSGSRVVEDSEAALARVQAAGFPRARLVRSEK
ncbi:SPOR domain-containing protein [bacterium]|nr:SPOR domain-containing protein [Desulfobulbaceae bacterium]MCK5682145.1 SPOR domain-containing protein [bacterium]